MHDNKPLITIITPTYNRKELLEKSILSVINQKKDIPYEWELLIIDDGSIDGTQEYIQKYLDEYKRNIKYFYQQNSGVAKARNIGLNMMSIESDYLIFLDSDDELIQNTIFLSLLKWKDLMDRKLYSQVVGIYFFKINENWGIIWDKAIFSSQKEFFLNYNDYLSNKINYDTYCIFKSSTFLNNTEFRFDEDIISEAVLWAKIWKYFDKNSLNICFINEIWMLYRINNSMNKITKTISQERFKKNAIWNERVIKELWQDFLTHGHKKTYADYLFRTGINWVLYWDKSKWLNYIFQSLKYNFDLKIFCIFILSIISRKIVLLIYKLYI